VVREVTKGQLRNECGEIADPDEQGRRQDRLQRVEAGLDRLPFDVEAARAYGRIYAAVVVV
jgi:predicted nucleic acid-binding protein